MEKEKDKDNTKKRKPQSMNDFLNALTGTTTDPEILVYFRGSSEPAVYTAAIMDLLKSDPDTMTICDAETGEILFTRQ